MKNCPPAIGRQLQANPGFSLVEVLLSIALFALLVMVFAGALSYGQENERLSGDRARAVFLAEEGLEAARNMREENFENLTDGTHGLAISGNQWSFSGTFDTTDIFSRSVIVSSADADRKTIVSTVTWKQNAQRDGSVTLTSQLTNWRKIRMTEAEQLAVDVSGAEVSADKLQINGVTVENVGTSGNITIAQMQVSWTGAAGGTKIKLINIGINGSSVWTGSNSSGAVEDIADFSLAAGSGNYPIDHLTFSRDMTGATITVVFTMLDGTAKQATFSPGAPSDSTAPAGITNLSSSGATASSINLSWTAPGDDGNSGTASSYDIRYSTSPITESNWNSAIQASGEPAPAAAGTNQSMTVSGLTLGTTYYFAMKTSDEIPNISGLSNVTSLATTALAQANYLLVNTAGAAVSGNSVTGVTLQNSGPANITIASMAVSWTGISGNRKLTSIMIGGTSVWTGSAGSGATENITDRTLVSGAAASPMSLGYSSTISGITVSIVFTMADGSSKTVSGIGPL